jgi:hypothetical protein
VSPDGQYVYVAGYFDDAVAIFARNAETGLLQQVQVIQPENGNPPLDGARDIAVHPDGRTLFVTAFLANQVVALPRANPTPTLTSLSPASVFAGADAVTLTVNGKNFLPDSQVEFGGTARPTTFVSSTRLEVQVPASEIANAGTLNIQVRTPEPGGGTSNVLPLSMLEPDDNPIPTINALLPSGAAAGSGARIVGIEGTGFVPSSQAQWNGNNRPTTYVSATYLEVQLAASDLLAPGQAGINVVNPTPGGGTSNVATFTVAAPGENPLPTITQLSPAFITAQSLTGTSLTITLIGANFVPDSQVQWNGANRPTTYVSATELQVEVSAAELSVAGSTDVTVVNPAPGGGVSNTVAFKIGAVGDNPIPALISLMVTENSDGTYTLQVTGSGFVADSQVRWNGEDVPTTLVDANTLTAIVLREDIRTGRGVVTVVNPAPGGGTSRSLIYQAELPDGLRVYLPTLW